MWVRNSLFAVRHIFHYSGLENVCLCLSKFSIIFFAMYIPPDIAIREKSSICDFIIDCLDDLSQRYPSYEIILCGDLNRFNTTEVCRSLNLCNLYNKVTYGDAELDYILFSKNLCEFYCVTEFPPIDISKVAHVGLLATPISKCSVDHRIVRKVYDLRSSHVSRFVLKLRDVSWRFLKDTSLSLNEKCIKFHDILESAANECIPFTFVTSTSKD